MPKPERKKNIRQDKLIVCDGYEFSYRCPLDFFGLGRTDVKNVSYCDECQRKVYFCETDDEVAHRASQGHCIAVYGNLERKGRGVTMGIISPVPDITDTLIASHKDFLSEIDARLTSRLRSIGFQGPRSCLNRKSDHFVETVEIETSAARAEFSITLRPTFVEVMGLSDWPRHSVYWKRGNYGNCNAQQIAEDCSASFFAAYE